MAVSQISYNDAVISWATDELSSSEVKFGELAPDDSVRFDENMTTNHTITLTGLKNGTRYQFIVISRDMFGNETISTVSSFNTMNNNPVTNLDKVSTKENTLLTLLASYLLNILNK